MSDSALKRIEVLKTNIQEITDEISEQSVAIVQAETNKMLLNARLLGLGSELEALEAWIQARPDTIQSDSSEVTPIPLNDVSFITEFGKEYVSQLSWVDAIIHILSTNPDREFSPSQVRVELENYGRPSTTNRIASALSYLKRQGRVRSTGWGIYTSI